MVYKSVITAAVHQASEFRRWKRVKTIKRQKIKTNEKLRSQQNSPNQKDLTIAQHTVRFSFQVLTSQPFPTCIPWSCGCREVLWAGRNYEVASNKVITRLYTVISQTIFQNLIKILNLLFFFKVSKEKFFKCCSWLVKFLVCSLDLLIT